MGDICLSKYFCYISFAFDYPVCLLRLRNRDAMLDLSFDFSGNLCRFCHYFEIKMLVWHCQLQTKYTNVSYTISSQNYSHMYTIWKDVWDLEFFPFCTWDTKCLCANLLFLLKQTCWTSGMYTKMWSGRITEAACELNHWIKQNSNHWFLQVACKNMHQGKSFSAIQSRTFG